MELTCKFHILLYVCVSVGAFLCVCVFTCAQWSREHHGIFPHFADSSRDKRNLTSLAVRLTGIMSVSAEHHEGTNVEVTNLAVGGSVKESVLKNVTAELNIMGWFGFCQVKCL